MKTYYFLFLVSLFISYHSYSCSGGTNAGTLTPTTAYQTQAVSNGQYYVVSVTCGSTYNFTFCSNGGSASWDTQITINQTNNTTQLAYNDDACGLQSNVSWTATFSGTVHVLISQYSCNNAGGSNGTLAYNVTSTAVTYAASCSTANPIISGATGGTFSFNPVPTDGATINASTGIISNGTEGASYSVDYVYCGGTISIPVTMGSAPCFSLNGNGQYINVNGEQCIQLTAEINNQTGCAWSEDQIDFNSDFTLSLDYYFGNNINGADGNTFTFQPSSSTACGQAGGQLGAGGLSNALAIEFDTYDNDNPTHLVDMSCDHIAVEIDGNMLNGAPYCGPVCAKPGGGNIDDGGVYPVDIEWNSTTQTLSIYFNGVLRLACSGNFVSNVFGGQNNVYWGATSATGGLNNQQYFCPSTVVILPVELSNFDSYCNGENEVIEWVTISERDLDYFQIEYTYDGLVYYPVGQVESSGNSTEKIVYSYEITEHDNRHRYYRLKIVDLSGSFEYTDIISGKGCYGGELIDKIETKEHEVIISLADDAEYLLFNSLGQLIASDVSTKKQLILNDLYYNSGIYLLHLTDGKGNQLVQKILIP